jgi:pilus assembly protein Flp/PilA
MLPTIYLHDDFNPSDLVKTRSTELMTKLYRFFKDESGVTAIEYGLIAAGIGIAIVVVVGDVGTALFDLFTSVEGHL